MPAFAAPSPRTVRTKARDDVVKAVLGPTNTGKTHLAIERLCAHSSGAIGFPLRLLAREVYDRVVAIKGADRVALITGEERIEPKNARWLLCTAEAMPAHADLAFMALDEAQIGADPERGHVFTDRLLHMRGREETMLLGSATLEPMVRALVPEAEIVSRPRFSTLSHVSAKKLSRVPPRSAIVAFSTEQVYVVAEMLRRFRGGAAVVMGALSPQTRNAQVELFQSGEVDYIVATDAIGMGLNLDLHHVAFAGLSKFDGWRQRRLHPAEMAQIAGRAGRHQRDGTFGILSGASGNTRGPGPEFTDEEVYAIEEHRFAPLTRLYWREAEPRFDNLATLIADLELAPDDPALAAAPLAVDLAVLKYLSEDTEVADTVHGPALVERFWEACRLPDFRSLGTDQHARFIARLWQDLGRGNGCLGADFVAQRIAELDRTGGDIDTLQARIAAIRSWSYIAQRADWVMAREEMAMRARAVEARLSDALHARLTERFVNRRTSLLMKNFGPDAALLPVTLGDDNVVLVDDEPLGSLTAFRFTVDPQARHHDRKLLLAAADRHLPELLTRRAAELLAALETSREALSLREDGAIVWREEIVAQLEAGRSLLTPRLVLDRAVRRLPAAEQARLAAALVAWLESRVAKPLGALVRLDEASRDEGSGPAVRALALALINHGGYVARRDFLSAPLAPAEREALRRCGVRIGALDLYVPDMLRGKALATWAILRRTAGLPAPRIFDPMPPVIAERANIAGYRRAARQHLRVDMADKLLHAAHGLRSAARGRRCVLDPALGVSMGLTTASYAALLREAGFRAIVARPLRQNAAGPPAPLLWDWKPPRPRRADTTRAARPAPDGAFAALAEWGAA